MSETPVHFIRQLHPSVIYKIELVLRQAITDTGHVTLEADGLTNLTDN